MYQGLLEGLNLISKVWYSILVLSKLLFILVIKLSQAYDIVLLFTHFLLHWAVCESLRLIVTHEVLNDSLQHLPLIMTYSVLMVHFLKLFVHKLIPNINNLNDVLGLLYLSL